MPKSSNFYENTKIVTNFNWETIKTWNFDHNLVTYCWTYPENYNFLKEVWGQFFLFFVRFQIEYPICNGKEQIISYCVVYMSF